MFTPKWKFDFKISIINHIVSVAPGKQISIPVKLELIRGKPQPVTLIVETHWESVGLTAVVIPAALTPSQPWEATMIVRASLSTPPGSYLFTVRGGTAGTFNTSVDAVTVIVEPKAEQREDERDNIQLAQPTETTVPTPSLDNLFAPSPSSAKSVPLPPKKGVSPVENQQIKKETNVGSVLGVIFGIIILIVVFSASGVFKDIFKGGGGGTCPASAPIDCGGGCCAIGDGGRTDVCCPGNKCTRNGECGSTTVNPGGCPPLDCGERGLGGHVPKQCPCPPGCPYEHVTNLPGFKQCSIIR